MLDEVGFLDEDFFLYGEDTDLSFRAQIAGWKCMYVADALVEHKFHGTSEPLSDLHVYYNLRNLEFVWLKNMPFGLMLRFGHHKLAQEVRDVRDYCIGLGKWGPYLRAKRDALRMFPRMVQRRGNVQRNKRVSNDYIRSILTPMFGEAMDRHRQHSRFVLQESGCT
jgi:GT2 family glycosyltransferase